jgi:hypothetical protein
LHGEEGLQFEAQVLQSKQLLRVSEQGATNTLSLSMVKVGDDLRGSRERKGRRGTAEEGFKQRPPLLDEK